MTPAQQLQDMVRSYSPAPLAELYGLAEHYQKRRERALLDVAATAADVSAHSILNLGLEPEVNPTLLEAFRLQYPNVPLESLPGSSPERLEGLARGVKGKYFELLVRDRLNAGEALGELALAPGQTVELAASSVQPGHDLTLRDADGSVAEYLQLKATSSMAYVKHALTRYPDIRVVATEEIDGTADAILQTNISNAGLQTATDAALAELGESAITDLIHQAAEFGFDAIPLVPLAVVTVTEGRAVLTGRSSVRGSLDRGSRRVMTASLFTTFGALLTATGIGASVAVPTTAGLRLAWERLAAKAEMGEFVRMRTDTLRALCVAQT